MPKRFNGYDKAYTEVGSVLRPQCTNHNLEDMRTHRPKEADPDGTQGWRPMRRGIADLHRRAEVSQKANERYLDAMVLHLPSILSPGINPAGSAGRRQAMAAPSEYVLEPIRDSGAGARILARSRT